MGFNSLLKAKEQAKAYFGVPNVRFALEPTGQYWSALAEWLECRGEEVRMVQPAHTHKVKELEDNSPGKHDIKDSAVIADLDIQGKSLRLVRPQGVFAELRHLTVCRQGLVKDLNREINRLHGVLDVLFPELIGLFKNHIGKGLLELLKTTACPAQITRLGEQAIAELLRGKTRGKLGINRAGLIVQTAQTSIGIKEGQMILELELRQLLDRLEFIQKQLKEIEQTIKVIIKKVPDIDILLSIPAIGVISLATILGEVGDMQRYHSARQIIKLAGLNLYEISSGQHHGAKRISKRGRPLLRQILYMASLRLIKAKGKFYDFYQRLTGTGKSKIKAIVAVMCKLVRVIFAMFRDRQMYDEKKGSQIDTVIGKRNEVELALN
jgi:transposase